MNLNKAKISKIFILISVFTVFPVVFKYAEYIRFILNFPFDWEPTDGDHLNIANRIMRQQPTYFSAESGHVLNIYNPLFHSILGTVLQGQANFELARVLIFILWATFISIVGFQLYSYLSFENATLLFMIFLFPPVKGLFIDLMQISPSALLGVTTLISGIIISKWEYNKEKKFQAVIIFAGLCTLTFQSKQQGIIILVSLIIYLILKKTPLLVIFGILSIFVMLNYAISLYFNSFAGNSFWSATFFELNQLLTTYWKLGVLRFIIFCLMNSLLLVLCAASILQSYKKKNLNFWQVLALTHFPFLPIVLSNGGGGPNYLLTFYIAIIFVLRHSISSFSEISKNKYFDSQILLRSFLSVTLIYGSFISFSSLSSVKYPDSQIRKNMELIKNDVLSRPEISKCEVLTNRNIGIFLETKCEILSEGVITFVYAWPKKQFFNDKLINDKIRSRRYSYILSGTGAYPPEVSKLILQNYKVLSSRFVNLNYGSTGMQSVYVPKK